MERRNGRTDVASLGQTERRSKEVEERDAGKEVEERDASGGEQQRGGREGRRWRRGTAEKRHLLGTRSVNEVDELLGRGACPPPLPHQPADGPRDPSPSPTGCPARLPHQSPACRPRGASPSHTHGPSAPHRLTQGPLALPRGPSPSPTGSAPRDRDPSPCRNPPSARLQGGLVHVSHRPPSRFPENPPRSTSYPQAPLPLSWGGGA